ncbi:unnamed protein product [Owenia fusiformis]|uniref:Uncharacterized protein n=1 Tax=Owenia fusiformis TaxID=6347 RepID=A0A8S4N8M9_OWEFU|nr:unnamed protein product [Owenia fusiformis]
MNNMMRKSWMGIVFVIMVVATTYCNAVVDKLNKVLSSPRPPHGLTPSSPLIEFEKHGYKGCGYDNWCYIDDEGEGHYCMTCPEFIIQDGCSGECCRKNRGVQEGKFQCASTDRDVKRPECPKIEIPDSKITCHPDNRIMWIQTECLVECLNTPVHKYYTCARSGAYLQWVPELSQELCRVEGTTHTAIDTTTQTAIDTTTIKIADTTTPEFESSQTLYDIVNASDKMYNLSQSTGTIDEAKNKYLGPVVGVVAGVVFMGLIFLCFCLIRKCLRDPKWKPLKNRFIRCKPKEENPGAEEVPLNGQEFEEVEEKPRHVENSKANAVSNDPKTEEHNLNLGKTACEKEDTEDKDVHRFTPVAVGPKSTDDNDYSLSSLNLGPNKKDDYPIKIMPELSASENTFEFIESKRESEELEALIGPKETPNKPSISAPDSSSPIPQISPAGLSSIDSVLFKYPKDANPHAGGDHIVGVIDEPKSDGNMKAVPELCPSPSYDFSEPGMQAAGGYVVESNSMGIDLVPVREEGKPKENYGGAIKYDEPQAKDPNEHLKTWVEKLRKNDVLLDDMWQMLEFQKFLQVILDPGDEWISLEYECPVKPIDIEHGISMNDYIEYAKSEGKKKQSCTKNTINGILKRHPGVTMSELLLWFIKHRQFSSVNKIKTFMERHGHKIN